MKELEMKIGGSFVVESLGCIANQVDGKRVESFLLANGWTRINSIEMADLVVLMTCGFTSMAEEFNLTRLEEIKKIKRAEARMIVGGCLPSINKERLSKHFEGFTFSPRTLHRLNNLVRATHPIEQSSSFIVPTEPDAIVPIRVSTGCMSHCTYCAIPFANGRTKSRPIAEVLADIQELRMRQVRSIRLVSEDIGAYGLDVGLTVIELLDAIARSVEGVTVYLDNFNPNWLFHYRATVLSVLDSPVFAKSFYVPVQSGSDRILQLMERGYTSAEAREVLLLLRQWFPESRISTDIIVGFPSETEDDFEESKQLLSDFSFDYIEVFTYEDRPRIKASAMEPKLSDRVKEQRRSILFQLFLELFLKKQEVRSIQQLRTVFKGIDTLPINFNLVI